MCAVFNAAEHCDCEIIWGDVNSHNERLGGGVGGGAQSLNGTRAEVLPVGT